MNFKQQAIKGLFLIKPSPFIDKRGLFRRAYCARELKLNNINFKVKQINLHCLEIHRKGHRDIIVVADQYQ